MTTQTSPSRSSRISAIKTIILCLLAGLFSTAFAEDWDGSTSKPSSKEIDGVEYYVITSPSELAWFAYQMNHKKIDNMNVKLGNDILFMEDTSLTSSLSFPTIGDSSNAFSGIFDGCGFTIYGMKGSYLIFRNENEVKNITFRNSELTSVIQTNNGFVDKIEIGVGMIVNVVSYNNADVKNCKGLGRIAYNNKGRIESCLSENYAIVSINSGVISKSRSFINKSATISGTAQFGGIADENSGTIEFCESVVSIKKIGYSYKALSQCTYVKDGKAYTDAIFGVTGTGSLGGVVGENLSTGVILQSNAFFTIDSILGINIQSSQCKSLTASSDAEIYVGGVTGHNQGKIVASNSSLNIKVPIVGTATKPVFYFGGIAGGSVGTQGKEASIEQTFSSISVGTYSVSGTKGNNYHLAGFSAMNKFSLISDSHADSYFPTLTRSRASAICTKNSGNIKNVYGIMKILGENNSSNAKYFSGIIYQNDASGQVDNAYYDINVLDNDSIGIFYTNSSNNVLNVIGKTTAVMQSPAFVETLNTNAGLDDDSGLWQYCEGNYPILVTEGTCEEFYSKYGMSSSSLLSSSSSESSSSTPVGSCSSEAESSSSEIESSSSSEIASNSSSSRNDELSSSSKSESSSSAKSESSSSAAKSSSSSKENSSSSKGTDIARNTVQPTFNLTVNGMTLTLSNTQGGVVRIFDALGHMVAAKSIASATTSITLQTPGNYIVRVNRISRSVTLK